MTDIRDLHERWAETEKRLSRLRPLFALSECESQYKESFQEYIEHRI